MRTIEINNAFFNKKIDFTKEIGKCIKNVEKELKTIKDNIIGIMYANDRDILTTYNKETKDLLGSIKYKLTELDNLTSKAYLAKSKTMR